MKFLQTPEGQASEDFNEDLAEDSQVWKRGSRSSEKPEGRCPHQTCVDSGLSITTCLGLTFSWIRRCIG
jgi:hypothetical protein